MALIATPSIAAASLISTPSGIFGRETQLGISNDSIRRTKIGCGFRVRTACLFNPSQEPILKEALKEPVAFAGGILAGILRLDLNEDPLKEWVARTVEASGISDEEIRSDDVEDEIPQQIEIE